MEETEIIKSFKDRIRILLILYFFSENYFDQKKSHLKKVFTSEVRIQKLDFLLRNPDYLAYELLLIAESNSSKRVEIKDIVKQIFLNKEPILRRLDMERFFFGAYEDIDDVIAFLTGIEFVEFSSSKALDLKTTDKRYFLTEKAVLNIEKKLPKLHLLNWYIERLNLIKKFFGHLSGSELKAMQYDIEEYKSTSWGDYISDIQLKVKNRFNELFGENL